uniref:Uncharacterized protein n=1 Tax=Arundo donax TaxID=35708 RepID=A0A0A8Z946_ARUDO
MSSESSGRNGSESLHWSATRLPKLVLRRYAGRASAIAAPRGSSSRCCRMLSSTNASDAGFSSILLSFSHLSSLLRAG